MSYTTNVFASKASHGAIHVLPVPVLTAPVRAVRTLLLLLLLLCLPRPPLLPHGRRRRELPGRQRVLPAGGDVVRGRLPPRLHVHVHVHVVHIHVRVRVHVRVHHRVQSLMLLVLLMLRMLHLLRLVLPLQLLLLLHHRVNTCVYHDRVDTVRVHHRRLRHPGCSSTSWI